MSIFDSPIFDPRHALPVHILELLLVTVIIVLTIVRMTDDVPFTRGQIMCLTMVGLPCLPAFELSHFPVLTEFATHRQGAKSIHVIVYQILTKHVSALRRFGNNLVNAILNITEIATWPVAIAFLFIGNSMVCVGDSCTIQWVITVLALVML